jgi:hypothetical protein
MDDTHQTGARYQIAIGRLSPPLHGSAYDRRPDAVHAMTG